MRDRTPCRAWSGHAHAWPCLALPCLIWQSLDKLLLQKLATPNLEFELGGRTIGTIVTLLQEEEGEHRGQDAYAPA